MILPIIAYGAAILRQRCDALPADYPSDPVITRLVADMKETMTNANGAGLAAPQVNVNARLFIIDARQTSESLPALIVFFNPIILSRSAATLSDEEGCLSIPGLTVEIKRAEKVTVSWSDESGRPCTNTFEGRMARAIQHEYDHLEGRLYLDYLIPFHKKFIHTRLERIRQGKVQAPYLLKHIR